MISVVIPVYNTEPYIKKCLDSVIYQTYGDLEIILIDDGSTDGSPQICDEYAAKDDRIRVYHLSNGGVSAARNYAIGQCNGEWISFVDSDDWLDLDMYKKMTDLAQSCGADTVCCGAWQGDEEATEIRHIWRRFAEQVYVYEKKDALGGVIEQSGTLWNKLLSSRYAKECRFHEDIRYAEDTLFLAEYLLRSNRVVATKDPLYYYRYNRAGNVVSSRLNDRHLDYIKATKQIYDILAVNNGVYEGLERSIDTIIRILALVENVKRDSLYVTEVQEFARYINPSKMRLFPQKVSVKQLSKVLMVILASNCTKLAVLYAKFLIRRK